MAATTGGVAVGSAIGHGISNMLFGGSSSHAPAPVEQVMPVQHQAYQRGPLCEVQAKEFMQCLEKADLQSCSWYLEQLKAVSQFSAPLFFRVCSLGAHNVVPVSCCTILVANVYQ